MFKRSLNVIFIEPSTQKTGMVDIKGFRPISLVNGSYKIIAKFFQISLELLRRLFQSHKLRLLELLRF